MIYAYIRVSTDKQTVENQRFEIENYARKRDLQIEHWISETVSGTLPPHKRKLGKLIKKLRRGDVLIVSEISRLGRRLMEVMSILNTLISRRITVYTVKEGYELADNIQSQILAFAFGLAAQIERDLISQRTKEGLARRRAEGMQLGRKPGGKNTHYKLTGREGLIRKWMREGKTKAYLCQRLHVAPKTLNEHLERMQQAEELERTKKDCPKH